MSGCSPDEPTSILSEMRLQRQSVSYELTKHCNLRCARCDHSSPWFSPSFASLASYEADFSALSEVMEIDELRFAGGEPFLHPELVDFFRIAREREFARGITVLTNGLLLHKMTEAHWELLDALVISAYPGIKQPYDLEELGRLSREYQVVLFIESENSFNQMLLNDRIGDEQLVRAIYKGCFSAANCHTVYEGRYYKCSRAHLLEERMALIGKQVHNRTDDGIDLHQDGELGAALDSYLRSNRYLEACFYCLGGHGRSFPHVQLRKRDLEAEKRERHANVHRLLDPAAELDPAKVQPAEVFAAGWWRYDSRDAPYLQVEHRQRVTAIKSSDP